MCAGREMINCKSWTFNCCMINTSVSQSNPVVYLQLKNTGTAGELTYLGLQKMVQEPGVGLCCLEK